MYLFLEHNFFNHLYLICSSWTLNSLSSEADLKMCVFKSKKKFLIHCLPIYCSMTRCQVIQTRQGASKSNIAADISQRWLEASGSTPLIIVLLGMITKQECRVPEKKNAQHFACKSCKFDETQYCFQPSASNPPWAVRSCFSDHKFSCVETVKYKFDSGTWYVDVSLTPRCLCFCSSIPVGPQCCLQSDDPLSPPDRPQCWGRWHRLQQQGNHQCVIKAVQLCHQALTWLSSSRTPNPSALWRSKACHLHKPLTFNHWSVFLCKALTVRRGAPLSAPYRLSFEFNTEYVVGVFFFFFLL